MEERNKDSRRRDTDKNLGESQIVNGSFSLLDGASAQVPVITPELASLSKIASDKTRSQKLAIPILLGEGTSREK